VPPVVCELGGVELPDEVLTAVTLAVNVADALAPSAVVTTSCKLCCPAVVWIAWNCKVKVPLGNTEPMTCIC